MKLTLEEKAILAHVVIDPDAWMVHAETAVGEWAVRAKIERWRSDYMEKKDLIGYQTRVERETA